MKLRPMTFGWWIDLVCGAIMSTVTVGYIAGVGFIMGIYGMTHFNFSEPRVLSRIASTLFFLTMGGGGILGLVSLWLSVLLGPDKICRHEVFRRSVIVSLILGVAVAAFWLLVDLWPNHFVGLAARAKRHLMFNLLLLMPIVVGLRHLLAIIRFRNAERGVA